MLGPGNWSIKFESVVAMLDNPSEKTISERSYMKHKAKKTLSNEVTSAQKKNLIWEKYFVMLVLKKLRFIMSYLSLVKFVLCR